MSPSTAESPSTPPHVGLRRAGSSGLPLSEFALGFWHTFGHTHSRDLQRDLVLTAVDSGITHLDNANRYGPPQGSAEIALGDILQRDLQHHRNELIITTKAGNPIFDGPYGRGGTRKHLRSSIDDSLRRLRLDYVDVFYHHSPDTETPIEETVDALRWIHEQGKALYIGVSNYSAEQTAQIATALNEVGVPLLVHQTRFSLLDQRAAFGTADTLDDRPLFDVLHEHGIGAAIYSPLAQGLLTDKYLDGTVPDGSRSTWSDFLKPGFIDDHYLRVIQALQQAADARGASIAQLALRWLLAFDEVTSVILGASSVSQLQHNIAALEVAPLTAAERDELSALAR